MTCPKDWRGCHLSESCTAPEGGDISILGEKCLRGAHCRALKESLMFVIPFA